MKEFNFKSLQNGSDIRGIALPGVEGEEVNLTDTAAERISKGFLIWLSAKTGKSVSDLVVSVGRDPRLSGGNLSETICRTMVRYGVHVMNCSLASTPAMFMSTIFEETKADGAVMVTASHLPFNRNGMKFFSREGGLEKRDITEILTAAGSDAKLGALHPTRENFVEFPSLMKRYSDHLKGLITAKLGEGKPLEGLKIAVDAGNGSGGFFAKKVLEPLGADISASQFLEPDGSFPNHQPNPENEEAMGYITRAVKENHCDLGIIFDTDVDRSSAVDEHGREVNRNAIVAMAAALIAGDHPGTTVVTDSITSTELHTFLEEDLKLKHFRFRRGYRNVINKGIELNEDGIDCQLAIETSGHAAFKENYFLDDGAYLATLIVIRTALLKKEGKGISSVIENLKEPLESREVRMKITGGDFSEIGDRAIDYTRRWMEHNAPDMIANTCSAQNGPAAMKDQKIIIVEPNFEGVRVEFEGPVTGWFLLRKSLHDPIMPLNIESQQEGGCRRIADLLRHCLNNVPDVDSSEL